MQEKHMVRYRQSYDFQANPVGGHSKAIKITFAETTYNASHFSSAINANQAHMRLSCTYARPEHLWCSPAISCANRRFPRSRKWGERYHTHDQRSGEHNLPDRGQISAAKQIIRPSIAC